MSQEQSEAQWEREQEQLESFQEHLEREERKEDWESRLFERGGLRKE